jgi:geranylgeranyl reductase family protein
MAQAGLKVLGLEKQSIGRYKPCAGAISGAAHKLLDLDITHLICHEITSVDLRHQDQRLIRSWDQPVASLVMRDQFDAFLARKAQEAGATILEETRATHWEQEPAGVRVYTSAGTFTAKVVIAADGGQGLSRRVFQLKPPGISIHAEIPLEPQYRSLAARPIVWFGHPPGGYAWCFPKREYISCGAGTMDPKYKAQVRPSFDRFLELLGIRPAPLKLWAHPLVGHAGQAPLVHGRVLLVGDAGQLADPLSGEGILYGIYSGKAAGEAVVRANEDGDFSFGDYQRKMAGVVRRILRSAEVLSKLIHWRPQFTYALCTRFPVIVDYYFSIIGGRRPYPGCQCLTP